MYYLLQLIVYLASLAFDWVEASFILTPSLPENPPRLGRNQLVEAQAGAIAELFAVGDTRDWLLCDWILATR